MCAEGLATRGHRDQHPLLPVPTPACAEGRQGRQAKITTPNKRLLSILPLKNRFIFDKTRQNQMLYAKHYSVTAYGFF